MYESFYGLRERPFDLTPNPRFLYLSEAHREAFSNVQYGISGRKGITLLVGEAGTGKTTIVRSALAAMPDPKPVCAYLSNPALTREEFYEFLAASFEMSAAASRSKARFLLEMYRLVGLRRKEGRVVALVIDEAQSLSRDLMEEVRLLANMESATEKLLPLLLAGQPELADVLDQPEFRQLKQRVALRTELRPLNLAETAAYIAGRIRIAGGNAEQVLTRDAVAAVFERSGGVPRTISVICDNALVTGFAGDVKPIGRNVIIQVCRDFRIGPAPGEDDERPEPEREPERPEPGYAQPPAGTASDAERLIAPREHAGPDGNGNHPAPAAERDPAGDADLAVDDARPMFAIVAQRRRFFNFFSRERSGQR